jgi:hypothetical protein
VSKTRRSTAEESNLPLIRSLLRLVEDDTAALRGFQVDAQTVGFQPGAYSRFQNCAALRSLRMWPFLGSICNSWPTHWAMLPSWASSVLMWPWSIGAVSWALPRMASTKFCAWFSFSPGSALLARFTLRVGSSPTVFTGLKETRTPTPK